MRQFNNNNEIKITLNQKQNNKKIAMWIMRGSSVCELFCHVFFATPPPPSSRTPQSRVRPYRLPSPTYIVISYVCTSMNTFILACCLSTFAI